MTVYTYIVPADLLVEAKSEHDRASRLEGVFKQHLNSGPVLSWPVGSTP